VCGLGRRQRLDDDSREILAARWPDVRILREPNRGLASFNHVLARLDEPVVLLLNNDVKLDRDAVGPLVAAVASHGDALFAAPLCWSLDGTQYEGMRTRVRSRYGLVQGMCRVPGHERDAHRPDLTAAAGPVLAVDRAKFLALGGYDPLYFPGRIEDLDLGFRGWMAGWRGYYVPAAVAYHKGFGSFDPAFGRAGCDRLACATPCCSPGRTWRKAGWPPTWRGCRRGWPSRWRSGGEAFVPALRDALHRLGPALAARRALAVGRDGWTARQEAFFRRFRW
jgi:hypothetical protein